MTRRPVILAALATVAVLSACGGSSPAASPSSSSSSGSACGSQPHTICITKAFTFSPSSLSVTSGTVVTWVNASTAAHTATSLPGDPSAFDSGVLQVGQSHSVTLTAPGTYSYECSIHTYMTATVTVTR